MRLLHIDTGREMRGGQWQVLYLLEGLRERGHAVTLAAREHAPLYAAALARRFEVHPLSISVLSLPADLVHAHDAKAHTWAALLARKPLIVSRRVAFPVNRSLASRWKYGRVARFLAISNAVRAQLIDAGIANSRIDLVYDGVPLLPFTEERRIVVTPYFDDPRKAGPLVRQAESLAGVSFLYSRNLTEDLKHAAVLVYLTEMEGLGSAALLAMSAGVPVVASAVGGLPEAVLHDETGLLVENDAASVAAAVRRILDDPALANRLGVAARQRVRQCFTIEEMVRRTLISYEKALS